MSKTSTSTLHFEAALNELTQIVDRLEKGDQSLSLEDALDQFEKGVQLAQLCQKSLDEAEQKVSMLVKPDEHAALKDFDTVAGDSQADAD